MFNTKKIIRKNRFWRSTFTFRILPFQGSSRGRSFPPGDWRPSRVWCKAVVLKLWYLYLWWSTPSLQGCWFFFLITALAFDDVSFLCLQYQVSLTQQPVQQQRRTEEPTYEVEDGAYTTRSEQPPLPHTSQPTEGERLNIIQYDVSRDVLPLLARY